VAAMIQTRLQMCFTACEEKIQYFLAGNQVAPAKRLNEFIREKACL
jgi:hypothetical protein